MRKYILLTMVSMLATASYAQVAIWARQAGTAGIANSVSRDAAGNTYVGGLINDSAKFDNLIFGAHFSDAYIAKYDTGGNILWARAMGAQLIDAVYDIVTDAQGNSYITGSFQTNPVDTVVQFDTVSVTVPGGGSYDYFIAKYDANGNQVWLRTASGKQGDGGNGIAMDTAGNIYTTGYFSDTVHFGTNTFVTAGLYDMFIAKYTPAGDLVWAKQYGGAGNDIAENITFDNMGHIAITGEFQQTAIFGTQNVTALGAKDIFVVKLDTSGNALWAKAAGGNAVVNGDHGTDIAADAQGNLYITGSFAQTAYFGNLSITSHSPDTNYADIFVAKYDPSGTALWVHHAGGTFADESYGIAVNATGDSYITGYAASGLNVVFDNITMAPAGNEYVFIAKYSTGGVVQWVKKYASGRGKGLYVDGQDLSFCGGASFVAVVPAFDSIYMTYVDRAAFVGSLHDTTMSLPTSVKNYSNNTAAIIYPNPAANMLFIQTTPAVEYAYILTDVMGRVCMNGLLGNTANKLDISKIVSGNYFLKLRGSDGKSSVYKFSKE